MDPNSRTNLNGHSRSIQNDLRTQEENGGRKGRNSTGTRQTVRFAADKDQKFLYSSQDPVSSDQHQPKKQISERDIETGLPALGPITSARNMESPKGNEETALQQYIALERDFTHYVSLKDDYYSDNEQQALNQTVEEMKNLVNTSDNKNKLKADLKKHLLGEIEKITTHFEMIRMKKRIEIWEDLFHPEKDDLDKMELKYRFTKQNATVICHELKSGKNPSDNLIKNYFYSFPKFSKMFPASEKDIVSVEIAKAMTDIISKATDKGLDKIEKTVPTYEKASKLILDTHISERRQQIKDEAEVSLDNGQSVLKENIPSYTDQDGLAKDIDQLFSILKAYMYGDIDVNIQEVENILRLYNDVKNNLNQADKEYCNKCILPMINGICENAQNKRELRLLLKMKDQVEKVLPHEYYIDFRNNLRLRNYQLESSGNPNYKTTKEYYRHVVDLLKNNNHAFVCDIIAAVKDFRKYSNKLSDSHRLDVKNCLLCGVENMIDNVSNTKQLNYIGGNIKKSLKDMSLEKETEKWLADKINLKFEDLRHTSREKDGLEYAHMRIKIQYGSE